MTKKLFRIVFAFIFVILLAFGSTSLVSAGKPTPPPTPGPTPTPPPIPAGMRAGLRASDYGISPWPSPDWWVASIDSMASRFPGSTGAMIAVVVEIDGMKGPDVGRTSPTRMAGFIRESVSTMSINLSRILQPLMLLVSRSGSRWNPLVAICPC